MPYSPLRPCPKSSGLDPNYAPEGMLACLPTSPGSTNAACRGCHYYSLGRRCPRLADRLICTPWGRPDRMHVIFKPR